MTLPVIASILGNIIEYYDFVIYASFSSSIGQTFFPAGLAFSQIALTLATFGFTLLARPVGAVVLGICTDRRGRTFTMILCIALMAIGSLLITFTPGYQSIGMAAPLLIVTARLLHGFSLGGEFGSATSFLIEQAPGHEARAASWQAIGQIVASLAAAIVTLSLTLRLPAQGFDSYGFRIAAGLGALAGPAGAGPALQADPNAPLASRCESRSSVPVPEAGEPAAHARCHGGRRAGKRHYLSGHLHAPLCPAALPCRGPAGLCVGTADLWGQLVFTPLRWKLADYFDRTRSITPMLLSCALLFCLPWPMFRLVSIWPESILVMPLLFNVTGLLYFAALDGFIGLLFPDRLRGRGLTIGYSFGVVLFGGLAPLTNAALISWSGTEQAPAFYLGLTALISASAIFGARRLL
ncbi:MFS transporter [Gluconobacter oxydans]|nr:MFS transporter [Gluconobacter oxydans]